MPTLEKSKSYTDQAAAAYKAFKARTERNLALTREEKIAKLEMFLDSHVSIFDEYFEGVENHPGRLSGSESLSDDAKIMARDIAAIFASSATGRYYMRHPGRQGAARQARQLDAHGASLLDQNAGRSDARQSYLDTSTESFDKMMRRTSLTFDDQDPAVQAQMQAAQRRANWAAGPKVSPQDEANAQVAIARAQVVAAQRKVVRAELDIRNQQAAIAPLRAALQTAQTELTQAETEANQAEEEAHRRVAEARKYTSDEGVLAMTWASAGRNSQRNVDRARGRASQARTELDQAVMQMGMLHAALDNANRELREAQDRLDETQRAAQAPEAQRTLRTEDRTEGLNTAQMQGIRSISAFLYRNTMHGKEATRIDRGAFVDGILRCSPRQKLLMFYLIEKDKIHGAPTRQELLDSQDPQAYIPNLDEFKKHIFGGWFKGFFGRASGNALNWDKLSDVSQSVKPMMPALYQLIATQAVNQDPALAQALANAQPNPDLANAIQRVIDAGNIVVRSANPPAAAVNDFQDALDALNAYIASQEKSRPRKINDTAADAGFWLGFMSKPCSVISQFLSGGGEAASLKTALGQGLDAAGQGAAWDANVFGGLGVIASFITLLGSIVDIVRTGKSHPGGAAMTLEVLSLIKDIGAFGSSGYSAVSGFAKLAGHAFSGAAQTAVGGLGGAVGFATLIVGAARAISASLKENAINQYENNLDQIPTAGLSPDQLRVLNEKKELLKDIAGKQKMSEQRRVEAGGYQAAAGFLTTIAGGLAAGGVTIFAAAVVSGIALVVSITGAVKEYNKKQAERETVVDKYLGINDIFPVFKQRNTPAGQDFNKLYGSDDYVKRCLREECVRNLGFTSSDKLFAFIMWRYATALYNGAFVRNGTVMTEADEQNLSAQEKEERKWYTDLIRSFGMKVKYPANPGQEATPNANAIYKKLMK